jgi:hypothetical protein
MIRVACYKFLWAFPLLRRYVRYLILRPYYLLEGCAIAEAVSHRLPNAAVRVPSQTVMWDLW